MELFWNQVVCDMDGFNNLPDSNVLFFGSSLPHVIQWHSSNKNSF